METTKEATGAWSGVMAMPAGAEPTLIVAPGVLVAVRMGVTVPEPLLVT